MGFELDFDTLVNLAVFAWLALSFLARLGKRFKSSQSRPEDRHFEEQTEATGTDVARRASERRQARPEVLEETSSRRILVDDDALLSLEDLKAYLEEREFRAVGEGADGEGVGGDGATPGAQKEVAARASVKNAAPPPLSRSADSALGQEPLPIGPQDRSQLELMENTTSSKRERSLLSMPRPPGARSTARSVQNTSGLVRDAVVLDALLGPPRAHRSR